MISEVCGVLRNWFDVARYYGKFKIENGVITSYNDGDMGLLDGQYYRIIGSVFNDGVFIYPSNSADLRDEEFEGSVWCLAIPKEVVDLSNEIDEWTDKYGGIESSAMSPFTSESFGGYSYSKGSSAASGEGTGTNWQDVFAKRLNRWRKI